MPEGFESSSTNIASDHGRLERAALDREHGGQVAVDKSSNLHLAQAKAPRRVVSGRSVESTLAVTGHRPRRADRRAAPRRGAPSLIREESRHPLPPAQVEIVAPPIRGHQRRRAGNEPARRARRGRRPAAARPPRPPARRERRRPVRGARPARRAPGGLRAARRSRSPSAARVPTGTTGLASACANARAVARPIRRPVNDPGPIPTAIASTARHPPARSAAASTSASSSPAWRGRAPSRRRKRRSLSTSPFRVTATTRSSVAVSQPTMVVTRFALGPVTEITRRSPPWCVSSTRSAAGSLERDRPRPAIRRTRSRPGSGSRPGAPGPRRPRSLEAEQVEVGDRHAPSVPVPDRERGRGHGLGDAELAARSPDQRRLAGAELTADEHHVARPQAGGEPRADRLASPPGRSFAPRVNRTGRADPRAARPGSLRAPRRCGARASSGRGRSISSGSLAKSSRRVSTSDGVRSAAAGCSRGMQEHGSVRRSRAPGACRARG